MKKYLIISAIFAVLVSVILYSIFYVPQVGDLMRSLTESNEDISQSDLNYSPIPAETTPVEIVSYGDTFPNLTITSSDNFKTLQFGDLKLSVNSEYKLSESPEKINLKLNDKNEINGFFYPLNSTPRKDVNFEEFESELLKNTYSLAKKSNIPDSFMEEVFNLGNGSTVRDSIAGEVVNYEVKDIISLKNPNSAGFFFASDKEGRYKVIILTTLKLYIFNIKIEDSNYLKTQKTFYNIELVR